MPSCEYLGFPEISPFFWILIGVLLSHILLYPIAVTCYEVGVWAVSSMACMQPQIHSS